MLTVTSSASQIILLSIVLVYVISLFVRQFKTEPVVNVKLHLVQPYEIKNTILMNRNKNIYFLHFFGVSIRFSHIH